MKDEVYYSIICGVILTAIAIPVIADYLTPLEIPIERPRLKHAEMWNYTSGGVGYQFEIADDNIYYNLTGLSEGYNDAFDYVSETQVNGGSYLRANVAGHYKVTYSMSFESTNVGGLYGVSIGHNWDQNTHRNCYARRAASNSVGSMSITCFMDIDVEDNVSIMVESENTDRDIWIHTANINLIRVGGI